MNHSQLINLYLPEFRQRKEWLSAGRALQLVLLLLAALAVFSVYLYWQSARASATLAEREQARQQAVLAAQQLSDAASAQMQDQDLMQGIAELEQQLASKQALLQFMNGRQLDNVAGFSDYLVDLARYHQPGLGLNTVRLTEGGKAVQLEGEVLRAELVPLYLQQLSQSSSYQGKDFRRLEIEEVKPALLNRVITPGAADTATPQVWRFAVSTDGSQP